MDQALPALVLKSEALPRTVMNETPPNEANTTGNAGAASTTSDEQLMLAFSKGSSYAFDELFSRYKQPIYAFFRRRVFESTQAEELTQETFIALFRAAARYEPRALFRTYLYAIGFKILRAHRRKTAFRATFFGQRNSSPILPNGMPPNPAYGSAAPSRSSNPWTAKSCSCVNLSN